MKFATPLVAKSILSLSVEEVRPAGGVPLQAIIQSLGSRYSFVGLPQLQQLQAAPIVFHQGSFEFGGSQIQIPQLELHPDFGMIAATSQRTDYADAFIEDLIFYLEKNFGFQKMSADKSRFYGSTVIVEFNEAIEKKIEVFNKIKSILNSVISNRVGTALDFNIERIGFTPDPRELPARLMQYSLGFMIERRANYPYSQNRFFSSAPLQTTEHIETLERIEAILG